MEARSRHLRQRTKSVPVVGRKAKWIEHGTFDTRWREAFKGNAITACLEPVPVIGTDLQLRTRVAFVLGTPRHRCNHGFMLSALPRCFRSTLLLTLVLATSSAFAGFRHILDWHFDG